MAPSPPELLQKDTLRFASELSDLLNATVTKGIRISPVIRGGDAWVGYEIGKRKLVPDRGIPLSITTAASARLFLDVGARLALDEFAAFAMVTASSWGLFTDAEMTRPLVRYDYERDKGDGYPEAHIQIHATSNDWGAVLERVNSKLGVHNLHLPVGGRRFRPTVEDFIEFLVVEELVYAHKGWQQAVKVSRDGFYERQLKAAVRRNPDLVASELVRYGFDVRKT